MKCPKCHQIDKVQKVSAVVSAESSLGLVGNGEMRTFFSQTFLSYQLALPTKKFKFLNDIHDMGLLFLAIGVSFGFIAVSIYLYLLIFHQITLDFHVFLLLGLLSLLGSLIITATRFVKKLILSKNRSKRLRVLALWDKLYYCRRDDIVFLPGSSEYFRASETHKILDEA